MAISPVAFPFCYHCLSLSLDGQVRWVMNKEFFIYSLCLHCPTFLVKCLTVTIICSHMPCPSLSRCTYHIDISTQCHIICISLFQKFVLLGYVLSEGWVLLPPPPPHPVMLGRDIIFWASVVWHTKICLNFHSVIACLNFSSSMTVQKVEAWKNVQEYVTSLLCCTVV